MLQTLAISSLIGTVLSAVVPTGDLPLSEPLDSKRIDVRQAPTYWTPPLKSSIQFILTGIPDVDQGYIRPNAGIYEIDMFYTPAETMKTMNTLGQKVICYFSAATAESWRDDYKSFQSQDLGKELPDWPGERYLDIRRPNVFEVIKKRIDLAASKGCNAIEPDNVGQYTSTTLCFLLLVTSADVYSNDNGFSPPIVPADTIAYLHKVSAYARQKGMSVGIKNCVEILGDIFDDVDFAISEQCVQYHNCTAYSNFTTAPRPGTVGKAVFEVEYVNYTYNGDWSDDGVALQPELLTYRNVDFPGLSDEKLRRKLCNLDEKGVTIENPYLKINTVIKTLALDGFVMWCNGSAEITKTKDVGQRTGAKTKKSWIRQQAWKKMGGI